MSHWVEIDENNVVIRVTVGNDEDPNEGHDWLIENLGGVWLKTSYNTHAGVHYNAETGEPSEDQGKAFRKNYAAIGFTYDEELDAFIPPRPYESWILNDVTCLWEPPVPMPEDGGKFDWDESKKEWVGGSKVAVE